MRLFIHDFAGHPFPASLSRALAARGHEVVHGYCSGVAAGRGELEVTGGDPASLEFLDISDRPFERYSPAARLWSEAAYGRSASRAVRALRPDVVLSGNTPLGSQAQIWRAAGSIGARRVYWLQDFLGRGTRQVLETSRPVLGATVGRAWERLETALLRRSDAIVAIAEDFRAELADRAIDRPTEVIENWAPADEIRREPKDNPWSRSLGLHDRPVALYSGTLGLKHDPEHLVVLARSLTGTDAAVVVVSEGIGRDHLQRRKEELGLDNLVLLDFVDYDALPQVLGAADVCLVLLDRSAGTFSVPSKILSYLAAGRPVVAAMPAENLASRTLERARAGVRVDPGSHERFAELVAALLADPVAATAAGDAGHRYAMQEFDVDRIAGRMERVLRGD